MVDVSGGAVHQLNGWGMEFSAVPEPNSVATLTAVALGTLALVRRLRRDRES